MNRPQSFAEQVDTLKFLRSWLEARPRGSFGWTPNWWDDSRSPLYAWHVDPWMGRAVRRHSTK